MKWDGPKVRALRRHLGFTQSKMASHLGVRQQTISEWERDEHPTRRSSDRLLDYCATEFGFTYQEPKRLGRPPKVRPPSPETAAITPGD